MSLQFIYGPSGSGKSHRLYEEIIKQSIKEPLREFLVIVPEQFSMQIQRELVAMHPRKGILNIDVLSFNRLAWRIFEEVGVGAHTVLEDTGKNLLLRRVAAKRKEKFKMLGGNFCKPGYISQVKSVISELRQYDVSLEQLDEQIEREGQTALGYKLRDIRTLYEGFQEELRGKYITSEEILEELCLAAPRSDILRECVIGLDGFTGFTPIQKKLLAVLMGCASKICVTITLDAHEDPMKKEGMHKLSYLSKKTIQGLVQIAREGRTEIEPPIILGGEENFRFRNAGALGFLERHLFRQGVHVYEGEQKDISIHVARDAGAEAEFAARTIWRLVRSEGLRYRDIGVVCGNLDTFESHIRRAFGQNDIPCFLDRTKKIVLNPMVEFLRAALQVAAKSFSYESVFRYLRTGLAGVSREETDLLENYVLARGIRSRKRWEEPWTAGTRQISPETAARCQEIKGRFIGSLCAFADQVRGRRGTVRQKTEALYGLLVENDVQRKMKEYELSFQDKGAFDTAAEYRQIYAIAIGLFDKLVELLGDEPMSLSEYAQILDAGFEEAKVGMVPPTADSVLVGDLERTRLQDIKVLFFLGLNDAWVPKRGDKGSILSDLDREELSEAGLELAPTARENSYIQKFYLYLNLTKPSHRLYLSYGRISPDGGTLRPSYVVGAVLSMFPSVSVEDEDVSDNPIGRITSPESGIPFLTEGLRRAAQGDLDGNTSGLFGWYRRQGDYRDKALRLLDAAFLTHKEERLSPETAGALYGGELVNSVSRLEKFASCAYNHFLSYGLALREREEAVFQAVDMGNVFHQAMERYARALKESGYTWVTVPQEEQRRLADEALEKASGEYAGNLFKDSARSAYIVQRMKRMMRRTVWAMTEQLRAGRFVPAGYEVPFSSSGALASVNLRLGENQNMRLRGRIDRVDVCEDQDQVYVKVVDYKTSFHKFNLTKFYYGLQLQLVAYLNAAMELEQKLHPEKKIVPAGIFYYQIQDPVIRMTTDATPDMIQMKILEELRPEGLVNQDSSVVEALDQAFTVRSSVIPVTRKKSGGYNARESSVATEEQFSALSVFAAEKMRQLGCAILQGEADVNPCEGDKDTSCERCPYGEVCRFDKKIPGTAYRRLFQYQPKELWERIGQLATGEEDV